MEFLASTVPEIGKCICVPVKRHIVYLIDYKPSVENLRNQVQKLGIMRDDVKRVIELARHRGEVIKGVVEEWITKVDSIEEEARRLDDDVNENKRCFSGWCPNLSSRYRLGKKAQKMVLDVNELQQEGGQCSVVSDPAPHPSIESIPTGDFVDFGSTKSVMNQVMDALKDEDINIVGVYGLGGVGKTILMKQVGRKMKEENLYNEVVKVTISQNPVMEKIQDEIAEKLGLVIKETSEEARAARLWARLKQEKRVLLILDDLWEQLELSKIGIPYGSEHQGCKIVLTTRNLDVCNAMMSQATIIVQVLSDDDSWFLFKKYAGDFIESPSFHTVAKDVVKECGGLPLVITTLGRALREKGLPYWTDALLQLQRSNAAEIIGIDKKVFESLKISYNALGSEEIRLFFLFCCLFPEDFHIEIEVLMQYGIGEGLYKDVFTLKEARGRVSTLVDNLKARCLLLEGDRKGSVKMHDIIRDLAIKISSEDKYNFWVKTGLGLKRWPEWEEVDRYYRISFVRNSISSLPDRPECPKLRTLSLSYNLSLRQIPNNFFERMKALVVLDLSYTQISLLPSSFSCLINLRILRLQFCMLLFDCCLLGGLKNLEILSLQDTKIKELPKEMGELTNLKLLDLRYTTSLKIVRPNVISRMTWLEELYMTNSFSNWELQGKEVGVYASIGELTLLPNLTVLHIDIRNKKILSQDISNPWGNLREFVIRVGKEQVEDELELEMDNYFGQRCMYLDVTRPVANWVKDLAERTEHLYMTVFYSFKNIEPLFNKNPNALKSLRLEYWKKRDIEEFLGNVFGSLDTLSVSSCDDLRYLLFPSLGNWKTIQQLKFLSISSCDKMEGLISREVEEIRVIEGIAFPTLIFQNLRKLIISYCPSFKYIFSWKVAYGLSQLEELSVIECHGVKVLIAEEEEVSMVDPCVLPQLQSIEVNGLPRLESFFQGEVFLHMASLEYIRVEDCENLKRLTLVGQSAPNLQRIKGSKDWFEELEWGEDNITKSRLQPLFVETLISRVPFHEYERFADEAETSADEAETSDEAMTYAYEAEWSDEATTSADEAERSDEAMTSADEAMTYAYEAEWSDEATTSADEAERSDEAMTSADEAEKCDQAERSGHLNGNHLKEIKDEDTILRVLKGSFICSPNNFGHNTRMRCIFFQCNSPIGCIEMFIGSK